MTLNEYQKQAMTTCMETSNNNAYMTNNLVGEVGEFMSKLAKGLRKGFLSLTSRGNYLKGAGVPDGFEHDLKNELGDIMWQVAGTAHSFGWTLEEICQMNLDKLASRKVRGKIDGDGDNR